MDLLVLAKEPVAGRVKTRLCPPCSTEEAAALAAAALADTLDAAMSCGADRVLVALDGQPGWWCPPGVELVTQGQGVMADRLATAWEAATGPTVQIGMDTPQVPAEELAAVMAQLDRPATDAVLGAALDGGWWVLGLRTPDPTVFAGIATSKPDTGARQRGRLVDRGLRVVDAPPQRDVDEWADALAAAAGAPHTRFAAEVRRHLVGVA